MARGAAQSVIFTTLAEITRIRKQQNAAVTNTRMMFVTQHE